MIYGWSMEFDIVDIRLHCEVEDRCASSTLSNCDVGSSSSRRGELELVVGIWFDVLTGVRHAQHQHLGRPWRRDPQQLYDVPAYAGDDC